MHDLDATALLTGTPHELPQRVADLAGSIAESQVAVYVIDIDGSCLIRLAGDDAHFPSRIQAPVGVGPELPLRSFDTLRQICAAKLPDSACEPMIARDRAVGVPEVREEISGGSRCRQRWRWSCRTATRT